MGARIVVVAVCLAALLGAGCTRGLDRPARGESARPSVAATGSPDNLGPPFTGFGGSGERYRKSLASQLARFDRPPSLPATAVVGAANTAYAGPFKRPNGIWVHYPTGIFLSIQREPFDARQAQAEAEASTVRRKDGSPQTTLEIIGGRETTVLIPSEVVGRHGGGILGSDGDLLNWSQDGWHYFMRANGPRPASLELLKRAAASVP